MFKLFATRFINTDGKYVAGVVDTDGKFASGVIDTGINFLLVSLIRVVHLDLRYKFLKKLETVLMEYSGAGGKLIHEKNQKQNIL